MNPVGTGKRIKHLVSGSFLRLNYLTGRYRKAVWLIGSARSGTTWVSGLINHHGKYREMFEPFHPRMVPGMQFIDWLFYARPGTRQIQLDRVAKQVFSGALLDPWVDANVAGVIHRGLVIKDISAGLFAGWVREHYPGLPIVVLIRHPFSVAASMKRTREWSWFDAPARFLENQELIEDYLEPYLEPIDRWSHSDSYIVRQILIWAIVHSVTLRQLAYGRAHFCFYEDFLSSPRNAVAGVLDYARLGTVVDDHRLAQMVGKASRTALAERIGKGRHLLKQGWREDLSTKEIETGRRILETFGLSGLYDASGTPSVTGLAELIGKSS